MKVKLLVLFFLLMLFSISCSSSETAETSQEQASLSGILQSTKVLIQTDETYFSSVSRQELDDCFVRRIISNKCIERKVPLSIWPEMEETLTNYSNGGGKEQFCSLNGFKHEPGIPFEIGAKVEIIAAPSNDCQKTMLLRPGTALLKLPTAIVKVRVLDGKDKGLEGWTWAGAVKRD